MFDIGATELLLIVVVALLVIGPKDLPRAMRTVGHWMGKARETTRHFRTGIDAMIREAELEEQHKKWASENERIMREHPPGEDSVSAAPAPAAPPAAETNKTLIAASESLPAIAKPTMADMASAPSMPHDTAEPEFTPPPAKPEDLAK